MERIRWGIVGTGWMADVFAADFHFATNAELVAVGSRTQEAADAFAARHGLTQAHGSYQRLLDDDTVDVIYIATPHNYHRDIALGAIARGKAVVVEKAFTATFEGTEQVIAAAREAGVFCMEAMWTRFLPVIAAAREVVAWGRLGDVLGVQGDLCAYRELDPTHRLFAKDLAGGAILDLGVYPISFAQAFLGTADDVQCVGRMGPTGVDIAATMSVKYAEGGLASLSCGFDAHGPGRMAVYGTKGWIDVLPRFHHPTTIAVHREGALPRMIEVKMTGKGYAHEITEVSDCLLQGRTESAIMPLDDSLEVMRVMQECLGQLNLSYTEVDQPELL